MIVSVTPRPVLLRWTLQLMALLVIAAGAWLLMFDQAADMGGMGSMGGTMGLSLGAFVGMWALMMTAMMRPPVAPLAVLYSRTFARRRTVRLVVFTATYRCAWLRDVRVASHHATYCLGCCWALMALFVVTGTMHLGAMVVLTAIVAAEKLLPGARQLTLTTGALSLCAAVAVWWVPGIAPGLTRTRDDGHQGAGSQRSLPGRAKWADEHGPGTQKQEVGAWTRGA